MPSLTVENYVKSIFLICARLDGGPAATGQLAAALEVSPGTVTSMLKTLAESHLATYTPYEGVRLTDSGRALALRVLRRHRLIELFLVQTLGLSWDEVHEEAEHLEHAVSDRLIDLIDAHLGYPISDPHGDPIPRSDGSMEWTEGRRLAECQEGDAFEVSRVLDQSPEFLRYPPAR
jgi:DtxR family Mn-dependent transcriptional regulator